MSISHGIDSINFSDLIKVTVSGGIVNLDDGRGIKAVALSNLSPTEKTSLQEGLRSYAIRILNLSKPTRTSSSCITDRQLENLTNWVLEKSDSSEFQSRIRVAQQIIQKASDPQFPLKVLNLGLRGLTSLPSVLGEFPTIEYISIAGNYLPEYPEELLSRLPLLDNKEEIKYEINKQRTIYESPHLASRDLIVKANEDLPATLLSEKMRSAKLSPEQAQTVQPTFYQAFKSRIDQLRPNIQIPTSRVGKISLLAFVVLSPVISLLSFPIVFRYLRDQKDNHLENLKILSNISGIKELEGSIPYKMLEPASKAIKACDIPSEIKSPILSAIDSATKPNCRDILQQIQEGQLVVLPAGYLTKDGGHAATIVIYQNKMMICNRGSRAGDEYIYEYYQIDSSCWNEELIHNIYSLLNIKKDSIEEGQQHQSLCYYQALPKAIKAQKLSLPEQMISKEQSCGNCTIASIKAAVQASCFLLQGSTEQAAINAKMYKKAFSLTLRKQAVESVSGRLDRIFNYFYGSRIILEAQAKIKKHELKLKQLQTRST